MGQDQDFLLVDLRKAPTDQSIDAPISIREYLAFIEVARYTQTGGRSPGRPCYQPPTLLMLFYVQVPQLWVAGQDSPAPAASRRQRRVQRSGVPRHRPSRLLHPAGREPVASDSIVLINKIRQQGILAFHRTTRHLSFSVSIFFNRPPNSRRCTQQRSNFSTTHQKHPGDETLTCTAPSSGTSMSPATTTCGAESRS